MTTSTLSRWNVPHLMPIGSYWESWISWKLGEFAQSDGIMRIDKIDNYTVHFTYGPTHKNPGYVSRLMGTFGDYHVSMDGKRMERSNGNVRTFWTRSNVESFNEHVERVPVCREYACEHKIGPIANGFPSSYC